jgi:hypothetical protein
MTGKKPTGPVVRWKFDDGDEHAMPLRDLRELEQRQRAELPKVKEHFEMGRQVEKDTRRHGGRPPAEPIGKLRVRWESIRADGKTDTAADKLAAKHDAWAALGWEAVAAARRRNEKRGTWRRP